MDKKKIGKISQYICWGSILINIFLIYMGMKIDSFYISIVIVVLFFISLVCCGIGAAMTDPFFN